MQPPRAQYAWNGDAAIAYGVVGDGPIDLVYVQGYVSDVEMMWESPRWAAFMERIASWARLITIDRRGVGMSDRFSPGDLPPLEEAAKDVLAVLDAVGSQRAALFGTHEGGQLCAIVAATWPERVRSLVLLTTPISFRQVAHALGESDEQIEAGTEGWRRMFGTPAFEQEYFSVLAPSHLQDRDLYSFFSRLQRHAASPGSSAGFIHLLYETDISGALGSISVPTLVLHRRDDQILPVAWGQQLAEAIPGAELAVLEGGDWWPFLGDADVLLDEVERFVLGSPLVRPGSRSLATVMFTDIVGSTELAAALGDQAWSGLLGKHDEITGREVASHGGSVIKSTGDGVLATFDGPARATRCAMALAEQMDTLDLPIRAGLHTGEVEHEGAEIRGLAVHIAARVMANAAAGEVWASQTVKDLVAGSGLEFEDAGAHELKGVPDRWNLFRVVPG
jgi:class 3 adenylate cyclase